MLKIYFSIMSNKVLLMILDGWGIGKGDAADAIGRTPTPNIDRLKSQYAHTQLLTCGQHVGLPDGQMGNSEVGHLNIGAGRVVYQDLVRINNDIAADQLRNRPAIAQAMAHARDKGVALHLIGLVGDGGVHSLSSHLCALCDISRDYGLPRVYIHALTDGRDTDPKSGLGFVQQLEQHLQHSNGVVASLVGRYYTMDRDKRWERVAEGYNLMVHGKGTPFTNPVEAIKAAYAEGLTDEFIKPMVRVDANGNPVGLIKEGDAVICFNFRTDRLREITTALTQRDMPDHGMATVPNLHYVTMTNYDETFRNIHVAYDKDNLPNTLGEVVDNQRLKQLRIAETEKYAHVTFFFSGGREQEFAGEQRILIPSPKVATYDLQPEMSAPLVAQALVQELNKQQADFVCLNFANGDMVGHTGIYTAIEQAIGAVDTCVGQVVEAAQQNGYQVMIIADHGNADHALNADGSPNTAHSLNPVPCIIVSDTHRAARNGILADVAPTVLTMMGLPIPTEMTGKVLCDKI